MTRRQSPTRTFRNRALLVVAAISLVALPACKRPTEPPVKLEESNSCDIGNMTIRGEAESQTVGAIVSGIRIGFNECRFETLGVGVCDAAPPCCTAATTPGCSDDLFIEAAVCAADPFCCSTP